MVKSNSTLILKAYKNSTVQYQLFIAENFIYLRENSIST